MKTINDFLKPEQVEERNKQIEKVLKYIGLPKGGKWLKYVYMINENELLLNVGSKFYMSVGKGENGVEIKINSPIYRNPFVLKHDFTNDQISAVHEAVVVEDYCLPRSEDRFVGFLPQNKYSQYVKDLTHDFVYFNKNKVFHSDIDKVMYAGEVKTLLEECNADTIVKVLTAEGKLEVERGDLKYPRESEELYRMMYDISYIYGSGDKQQ